MYFSLLLYVHVRIYGSYGYIVSPKFHKAHIFNRTGAIFLSTLSHEKQDFSILVSKVKSVLKIQESIFEHDLYNFYSSLVKFGYVESDANVNDFSDLNYFSNLKSDDDIDSFFHKEFQKNPVLRSCQIEITDICNERCIHCYIPHEQKSHFMPYDIVENLFNQLAQMGCLSITLSGGEVFTHPDIIKILRLLQKYDFSVSILSNLTLLTDEIIECLKKIDLDKIHVSVYSLQSETHDYITQVKGSFEQTMRNIEKCLSNDIHIKISCPTMKANYKDFEDLLIWGNKNHIQVLTDYNIMARSDTSTDNLKQRLSEDEAASVINSIIKYDESYKKLIKGKVGQSIKIDESAPICNVGRDKICVSSTGNFYPCPGWHEMILGNIHKTSLKDVWYGSEKLNWLRSLKRCEISKCIRCNSKEFCLLCIQRNYNETKDIYNVPQHFCKIAALNKKLVMDYLNGL